MILSICIPTFNRDIFLKRNLEMLVDIIVKLNEIDNVDIYVLDNQSSDNTRKYVEGVERRGVKITYILNNKNIGVGGNIVKCFTISNADYFMTLGDDDYVSIDYMREVLNIIRTVNPEMILGNCIEIDCDGNILSGPREEIGQTNITNNYQEKLLMSLELAHQLSGLVYRKVEMTHELNNVFLSTIYPQIYLSMQVANKGEFVHILEYPVKVTGTNSKDWKYDISGCLFEILESFYYLPITSKEKAEYEINALYRKQIAEWRLSKGYKHPFQLLSLLAHNQKLENKFKKVFVLYFFGHSLKFYKNAIKNKMVNALRILKEGKDVSE